MALTDNEALNKISESLDKINKKLNLSISLDNIKKIDLNEYTAEKADRPNEKEKGV